MTNKKLLLIIASIIIILVAGYLFRWRLGYYRTQAKCPYLDLSHYGIDMARVDCFDIFSVGRSRDIYYLRDDKNDLEISTLKSTDQYKKTDNALYIFEVPFLGEDGYYWVKYEEESDREYPREYFMNNQIKEIIYNSLEEFPKYIQIQYGTGETALYNNYDEMPDEAKAISQELEGSYNKS